MLEDTNQKTARDYVMKSLDGKIFQDRNGALYTFEGVCVEGSQANTYAFKNHASEEKSYIKLSELESLAEIKSVQI